MISNDIGLREPYIPNVSIPRLLITSHQDEFDVRGTHVAKSAELTWVSSSEKLENMHDEREPHLHFIVFCWI